MAKNSEIKRLYRSRKDKIIAGVCGGIAEYFNIDPVWTRLIAVLLCFINGIGIILYIIAWILMPENPKQKPGKMTTAEKAAKRAVKKNDMNSMVIIGIVIAVVGILLLLKNLGFEFSLLWPFLLIALGIFIIVRQKNEKRK